MITITPCDLLKEIQKNDCTDTSNYLKVEEYMKGILNRGVGFYDFYNDYVEAQIKDAMHLVNEKKGGYSDVVVLGIGGSALGIKTIHTALTPLYTKTDQYIPRLHILENIDPDSIKDLRDTIVLEDTLFIVISKSGGTPETIAQYLYFKNLYKSLET